LQTLTAGDNLNGGLGADTLNITNTAAATLGAGVTVSSIETVNVTATAATTVDTTGFTGLTAVGNVGSTSDIIVNGLKAIPAVSVTGTSSDTNLAVVATAVVGASDAVTITVNGVATGTSDDALVTVNGIETINVVASGSASGSSTSTVNFASDAPVSFNVTGTTAKVGVNLIGATAAATGVVTSDAGAHDINLTADSTDKLSIDLGAGNDTLRVANIAATHTIAGGEGTDTLRYSGATAVVPALTANVTGIESVTLSNAAPASFGLAGVSTVTYTAAAAGTYSGLATGGTLNLEAGGAATLAATYSATSTTANAYTGAADSLTVNVGRSTTATGTTIATSTVSSSGIESVTINNLAAASNLDARTVGIIDSTATTGSTTSLTVTGAQATTVTASGTAALKTVNLSGLAAGATFAGTVSTTGATITGGAGNDALTGGTGADSISAGTGNDTINGGAGADTIDAGDGTNNITGGTGADVLTGGSGVDTFVFASNATTAATPVATSTSSASDTITNFVSGTDKISITGAYAPQAFLGNFPNIQTALSAAGAAGSLAYSAAFVTGENSLYVFQLTTGALHADDMVIKMTGVTALAAGDLLLGTQAAGATVTLTAPAAVAGQTGATSGTSVDGVASTTANLTAGNDTVNSTMANLIGSTATAGVGSDTLALSITAAAANGAEGAANAAQLASVTGFETITLSNFANSTGIANVYNLTIADANVSDNSTLTVTSSHAGLLADGTLSTAGVTFNASGLTSNRKLSFTGGSAHDVVVGGAGNDTLSGGDGNDTITGGAGVNNLSGGGGNDTIIVNSNIAANAAHTFSGGSGVADTFQVGAANAVTTIDLSASTFGTFEILDMGTNAAVNTLTMTAAQFAVFTALGANNVTGNNSDDVINLSTAGAVDADADIGTFSVVGGSTVTVRAAGQTIGETTATSPANDVSTITIGNITVTGRLNAFDTTDKLVLTNGANIAGMLNNAGSAGNTLDMNEVTITGSVSMTEAQYDGLIAASNTAAILAPGNADSITIPAGAAVSIVSDADIETYVIANAAANASAITNIGGAQNVTGTGGDDAITVTLNAGTYTGTLTGNTGVADVVAVGNGATDFSGATITDFTSLTIANGGTVTMTRAHWAGFTGTVTAAAAETVTLTTQGAVTTLAAVETYNLASGASSSTVTEVGNASHTIVSGTGGDTINIANIANAVTETINFGVDTATDRISINNPAIDPAETNLTTITNFNVSHDSMKLSLSNTALTTGGYQSITAGSNAAVTVGVSGVIEIEGSNIANFADVANGGAVELAMIAAVNAIANGSYTVTLYGSGNAAVYTVTHGDAGGVLDGAGDIVVEHLITLIGVTSGSLTSLNFYS
jgi:Ca2+-binding RTX toxin-like protein